MFLEGGGGVVFEGLSIIPLRSLLYYDCLQGFINCVAKRPRSREALTGTCVYIKQREGTR